VALVTAPAAGPAAVTAADILCDLLLRLTREQQESFLCFAIGGPPCRCNFTHAGCCPWRPL